MKYTGESKLVVPGAPPCDLVDEERRARNQSFHFRAPLLWLLLDSNQQEEAIAPSFAIKW